MADLTSTLTFTGVINGKTVSYSNTYTVEDVLDAAENMGVSSPDPTLTGGASFPALGGPTVDYSSPQFLTFFNLSDCDRLLLTLSNTAGAASTELMMAPGCLMVVNKSTDGGCFNQSGTATTSTFLDLDTLNAASLETNGPNGPFRVFAAYKNPAS